MNYTYVFPLLGTAEAERILSEAGYKTTRDKNVPQRLTTDCPPDRFQELVHGDNGTDGKMSPIPRSKTHDIKDIKKMFREVYKARCTRVFIETE